MVTADQIIDGILEREGEGKPPYLTPNDAGGRTRFGISERAHPEMWRNGPPSKSMARAAYMWTYVKPFNDLIHEDGGWADDPLRIALIDDGVMSGVKAATKRLQHVLGVDMDGVIGPVTLAAIQTWPAKKLLQAYVVERAIRITRLVQRRPSDLANLTGWVTRILGFLPEPV